MQNVSVADIKPNPFQARQSIDPERIRELAEEIKQTGFWPTGLLARQVNGHYELVFGHRRLEALKLLGSKSIELEIVELDDVAMATQTMIENSQREGLTDIEKANGIKRLMQFEEGAPTVKKVAQMLGYSEHTIREFLRLADLDAETKQEIERSGLPRSAVRVADQVAGPEFIRVAAQKKLKYQDLATIHTEVAKLKEAPRRTIEKKLRTGKLIKPEQVKRAVHRLSGQAIPKSKVPPDLHEVLIDWVASIRTWRKQLRAIESYREYIDSDPVVAEMFRKEVAGLIEDLRRLL